MWRKGIVRGRYWGDWSLERIGDYEKLQADFADFLSVWI